MSLFAKAHVFDRALQVSDFLGQRPHGVLDRLAVMSLRARLCKADRLLQAFGCRLEIRRLPRQSRRADGAPKEFLGLRDVIACPLRQVALGGQYRSPDQTEISITSRVAMKA